MTDLSNIKRVVIIDGYGRKMETVNTVGLTFTVTGDTLRISHGGDTTYSAEGGERFGSQ